MNPRALDCLQPRTFLVVNLHMLIEGLYGRHPRFGKWTLDLVVSRIRIASYMENTVSSRLRPFICAILIDLSGTIHIGSTPTPNALQALSRLRKSGIPFRFCSNTSKESTGALRSRLATMGIGVGSAATREEVWTSIGAVKQVVRDMGLKRPYLLLSDSARTDLESSLITPATQSQGEFDSVIVGLAPPLLEYSHLNTAFRILVGEHETSLPRPHSVIPLIATHKARYLESSTGLSLGPGPFVTALEHAAGVKAHVVGKPTRTFFETVIRDFQPEELGEAIQGKIAIIGDDVEADLSEGAIELGLWRVLVRTGKYRPGDENKPGMTPPDEIFDSFSAFIGGLLETQLTGGDLDRV